MKALRGDCILAEDGLPVGEVYDAAEENGESQCHHNDIIVDHTPLWAVIIVLARKGTVFREEIALLLINLHQPKHKHYTILFTAQ